MEHLNDRFEYVPRYKKGEYTFDGLAIPSMQAFEVLEEDGLEYVSKMMKEMLEWRKTMFGTLDKEHYGFGFSQMIVDTKTKVVLLLHGIEDTDNLSWLTDENMSEYKITKDLIEEHKQTTGRFNIQTTNMIEKDLGDRAFKNRVNHLKTAFVRPPKK